MKIPGRKGAMSFTRISLWLGIFACVYNLLALFNFYLMQQRVGEGAALFADSLQVGAERMSSIVEQKCGSLSRIYEGCASTRHSSLELVANVANGARQIILIEAGFTVLVMFVMAVAVFNLHRERL